MSSISTGGGGGALTLDQVLGFGNQSTNHMRVDGANTNIDAVAEDRTIAVGDSHVHANLEIGNGRTWTINGSLVALSTLTVSGTGVLVGAGAIVVI